MSEINLLPEEKKSTAFSIKIGSQAKRMLRLGGLILAVALFAYGGVFVYFFINNRLASSSKTELESQIRGLQPTEQKMVLLRDRISKAQQILGEPSSVDESGSLVSLTQSLPEGVRISDVEILPEELNLTVQADQSNQITELLRSLSSSGKYRTILMTSLAFSAEERYVFEIKTILEPIQN